MRIGIARPTTKRDSWLLRHRFSASGSMISCSFGFRYALSGIWTGRGRDPTAWGNVARLPRRSLSGSRVETLRPCCLRSAERLERSARCDRRRRMICRLDAYGTSLGRSDRRQVVGSVAVRMTKGGAYAISVARLMAGRPRGPSPEWSLLGTASCAHCVRAPTGQLCSVGWTVVLLPFRARGLPTRPFRCSALSEIEGDWECGSVGRCSCP